mmetsp:Transcript_32245/g.51706  ORF Transcript_32245/g.51706 Transcript_32245/m.51706 type:complete len:336 (-) Transcript_32245:144-1151(-)|eukprot:CAMPEP_0197037428 /NCGR_PEP_ID=MMETSP1384-20130603/14648_1 /TAXON_ID=29189 /ORGANISM="Ammonia sp." /LENGTH=335 /DNA_ID=CAMNT_0042467733 /DNA_START=43 /DNA_END=1050 /DNA_ORIENTATION=+
MSASANTNITDVSDETDYNDATSPSESSSSSKQPADSALTANNAETQHTKAWYFKLSNWIRILVLLCILSILTLGLARGDVTLYIVRSFLEWMKLHLVKGSFAFVGVYILCNLFMIPGLLLTVGAGYLYFNLLNTWYGIIIAIFIVCVSRFIGWTCAFLAARYIFRSSVHSWMNQSVRFLYINQVVKLKGFQVVLLLRLSPITPYGLLNYIMGITSVELKHYVMGHLGMIPDATVFCLVGASIASLSKLSETGIGSDKTVLIITVVLTVVSAAGMVYVGIQSKRELQKIAEAAKRIRNGHGVSYESTSNLKRENVELEIVTDHCSPLELTDVSHS